MRIETQKEREIPLAFSGEINYLTAAFVKSKEDIVSTVCYIILVITVFQARR